jgi:hypothetical protein
VASLGLEDLNGELEDSALDSRDPEIETEESEMEHADRNPVMTRAAAALIESFVSSIGVPQSLGKGSATEEGLRLVARCLIGDREFFEGLEPIFEVRSRRKFEGISAQPMEKEHLVP